MQHFAHIAEDGLVLGFYIDHIHGDNMPEPLVPITEEQHQFLLLGQEEGKRMFVVGGIPTHKDPLPPTDEQLAAVVRIRRDTMLAKTDGLVARHQDEQLMGDGTTLTAADMKALLQYRQKLRDITAADRFPNVKFPVAPAFVKE